MTEASEESTRSLLCDCVRAVRDGRTDDLSSRRQGDLELNEHQDGQRQAGDRTNKSPMRLPALPLPACASIVTTSLPRGNIPLSYRNSAATRDQRHTPIGEPRGTLE